MAIPVCEMGKIENGVMVMKDGKAWGVSCDDEHCTIYGWVNPCVAPIHDPRFCKTPTDVTYGNSQYLEELATAKLVSVERKTAITTRIVHHGREEDGGYDCSF